MEHILMGTETYPPYSNTLYCNTDYQTIIIGSNSTKVHIRGKHCKVSIGEYSSEVVVTGSHNQLTVGSNCSNIEISGRYCKVTTGDFCKGIAITGRAVEAVVLNNADNVTLKADFCKIQVGSNSNKISISGSTHEIELGDYCEGVRITGINCTLVDGIHCKGTIEPTTRIPRPNPVTDLLRLSCHPGEIEQFVELQALRDIFSQPNGDFPTDRSISLRNFLLILLGYKSHSLGCQLRGGASEMKNFRELGRLKSNTGTAHITGREIRAAISSSHSRASCKTHRIRLFDNSPGEQPIKHLVTDKVIIELRNSLSRT